jgi:hypothetical protein
MLIVDQYHVWTDLLTTLSKKTDFLFIKNWELQIWIMKNYLLFFCTVIKLTR